MLFADEPTPGYSIPTEFVHSSTDPHSGSFDYEYVSNCGQASSCYENLRRQEVATDLSALPADRFADAYLEIFVKIAGNLPSSYSEVRLRIEGGELYEVMDFVIPAGDYVDLQFPLSSLTSSSGPLTYADLAPGLNEWGIGGQWQSNTSIRVDDVSIHF